jgi:hypothetical protein
VQLGRTEEDRTTKVQRRVIIVNVAITHHVDFAALLLNLLSYRAHMLSFAHSVPRDGLLQVPQDSSSSMADDKLAKNSSGTCNDIDNLEAELTRLIYSMPNAELDHLFYAKC